MRQQSRTHELKLMIDQYLDSITELQIKIGEKEAILQTYMHELLEHKKVQKKSNLQAATA